MKYDEGSFSFNVKEEDMNRLKEVLGLDEIETIHNRFKEGKETEDDLLNHIERYLIKTEDGIEIYVVQYKYYKKLTDMYIKEKEKNKKYQGIENGTTIIYKSKAKYVREDRIEKYYFDKNKIREKIKTLRKREEKIYKTDYELEPVKAIDCLLLRIGDLEELLENKGKTNEI